MVKEKNSKTYSELLLQVNNDLAISSSLDEALDTLINIASSVIGAERGTAFINDNETHSRLVIEIDDKYWKAYFHRANSYVKLGGEKKYSIQFRKAMKDYNESIEIYDGNENAASFYNRGLLKEKIEIEACDDFVYSCDREYSDGCDRYNNICYPKTGELTLFNEFGRGVYQNSSNNKFILDNSLGKEDLVVVIRNYFTNTRVRAQFVRKGETLTMEKIPNGTFYTQDYMGNYWIKNLDPKNRFMRDEEFIDRKSVV